MKDMLKKRLYKQISAQKQTANDLEKLSKEALISLVLSTQKRVSDFEAYITVLEECKHLARIEKYPSSELLHFFDEVELIDIYYDRDD